MSDNIRILETPEDTKKLIDKIVEQNSAILRINKELITMLASPRITVDKEFNPVFDATKSSETK